VKIDAIKRAIEELGHRLPSCETSRSIVPLNIFYVELKPENNNKDIYKATHMLSYTVKFEPP